VREGLANHLVVTESSEMGRRHVEECTYAMMSEHPRGPIDPLDTAVINPKGQTNERDRAAALSRCTPFNLQRDASLCIIF